MLVGVLSLAIATSIADPIRGVAQAAFDLAERKSVPVLKAPRGSTAEIRALVQAFNSLAQQMAAHERGRREFASDISHELHALASAMQTAAEALESGAADQAPLSGRLVSGLIGHTRRLSRLADDLLELGRREGGPRLTYGTAPVRMQSLLTELSDEWAPEAQRRGMALHVAPAPAELEVQADPVRLKQALGNLVENALKYAGMAGEVRLEAREQPGSGFCQVLVTDTGPGIPAEALPHVFERYFRVEGRVGAGPGGMGLGLAIARGIALAHGGDLTAESPPEGGARFVLSLPRRPKLA